MSQDNSGFDDSTDSFSSNTSEQAEDQTKDVENAQNIAVEEQQNESVRTDDEQQAREIQQSSVNSYLRAMEHCIQSPQQNTSDQTGVTTEGITSPSYQYNSIIDEQPAEDEEQLTVSQLEEQQNFLDLYSTFVCLQLQEYEVLQFYLNFQSEAEAEEAVKDEFSNIFSLKQDRKTKIKYLLTKKKLFALYNLSQAYKIFEEQVNITNNVIQVIVLIKLQIKAFQLCKLENYEINGYYLPSLSIQTVPIIQKLLKRFQDKIDDLNGNYKTPYDVDLSLTSVKDEDVEVFLQRKPNCDAKRRQFKLLQSFGLEVKEVSEEATNVLIRRLRYGTGLTEEKIDDLKDELEGHGNIIGLSLGGSGGPGRSGSGPGRSGSVHSRAGSVPGSQGGAPGSTWAPGSSFGPRTSWGVGATAGASLGSQTGFIPETAAAAKLRERLVKAEAMQNEKQYFNSQDRPESIRERGIRHYIVQEETKKVAKAALIRLQKRNERATLKRTPHELHCDVQREIQKELTEGPFSFSQIPQHNHIQSGSSFRNGNNSVNWSVTSSVIRSGRKE